MTMYSTPPTEAKLRVANKIVVFLPNERYLRTRMTARSYSMKWPESSSVALR
jgi:hypothetical protein